MSLGERSVEDDRESDTADSNRLKSDLEIVTSSGRGKNGALCVLQSSIKLHIITSFGLSGKSFNQQYNSFQFLIISLKAVWTFGLFMMNHLERIKIIRLWYFRKIQLRW